MKSQSRNLCPNSAGALIETILCRVRATKSWSPFKLRRQRTERPLLALPQEDQERGRGVDRCCNADADTGWFRWFETEIYEYNLMDLVAIVLFLMRSLLQSDQPLAP